MAYPPNDLTKRFIDWLIAFYRDHLHQPFTFDTPEGMNHFTEAIAVWVSGDFGFTAAWQDAGTWQGRSHLGDPPEVRFQNLLHRFAEKIRGWGQQPPPGPTPVPGDRREARGRVRLHGRALVDDAGIFLGRFASYFHGSRTYRDDLPKFREDSATFAAAGVDALRYITDCGWPTNTNPSLDVDGPSLVGVLEAAIDENWQAHRMRTQVCILGSLFGAFQRFNSNGQEVWDRVTPYRLDSLAKCSTYAERIARMLQSREEAVALVEIGNEPENGGVGPIPRDWQEHLQRLVKQLLPNTLVCLGAPGGPELGATTPTIEDYRWYGRRGDMALPHLDRGYRDLGYGHIHQGIYAAQESFAWGSNEPIGPRSSGVEESSPVRLRMGANCVYACRGAYYVYHAYAGIGHQLACNYPVAQEPGLSHVFDGTKILPADLANFEFSNWHWNSNPVETLEGVFTDPGKGPRGVIRTIGCSHPDGRRVIDVVKSQGATLRARESMRLVEWQHDGTAYQQRAEFDIRAGQTRMIDAAEEILFVGTVI